MSSILLENLWSHIRKDAWGWTVFVLTLAAYVPMIWGSATNPEENNIISWVLWAVLAALFLYSSLDQGFSGWRLPLAFLVGNIAMVATAVICGGYYKLDSKELIVLIGVVGSVAIWKINQVWTGKEESRILFYGCMAADMVCFYPMAKYWVAEATQRASLGTIVGWELCLVGILINMLKVEKFLDKLRMPARLYETTYPKEGKKRIFRIIEGSLFSLEQIFYVGGMLYLMR